jgi:hypothetical protein
MVISERAPEQYSAEIFLSADDLETARQAGVLMVERLACLLAVWNDRFDVDLLSVTAECVDSPSESSESIDASLVLHDVVVMRERVDLAKTKTLRWEAKSFPQYDTWPKAVRRALELNYSAVRAVGNESRVVLLAAALEVLAFDALGDRGEVLESLAERRAEFAGELDCLFEKWDLGQPTVDRLRQRLLTTEKTSMAEHLAAYLHSALGHDYDMKSIKMWWKVRGKLAHGQEVEQDEVRQCAVQISAAVQIALRRATGMCDPAKESVDGPTP